MPIILNYPSCRSVSACISWLASDIAYQCGYTKVSCSLASNSQEAQTKSKFVFIGCKFLMYAERLKIISDNYTDSKLVYGNVTLDFTGDLSM